MKKSNPESRMRTLLNSKAKRADPTQGRGLQSCCRCSRRSISGLVRGQGLCPFHFAEASWGEEWARKCYPEVKPPEKEQNPRLWFEEYACGCVSELMPFRKLLGYCSTHGAERRHRYPEEVRCAAPHKS